MLKTKLSKLYIRASEEPQKAVTSQPDENTKYLATINIGVLEDGRIDIGAFWYNHPDVASLYGNLMWQLTSGELSEIIIKAFVDYANDDQSVAQFVLDFLKSWKRIHRESEEPMIDPLSALNIENIRDK